MEQTKPLLLIRKYRSILLAAVIVETVSFLVDLSDTIIGANVIGTDALDAIGLLAPFFSVSTLLCAIINSGTVMNYTKQIGLFNRTAAHKYFSEGLTLAVGVGFLYTAVLLLFKDAILSAFHVTGTVRAYASDYYRKDPLSTFRSQQIEQAITKAKKPQVINVDDTVQCGIESTKQSIFMVLHLTRCGIVI